MKSVLLLNLPNKDRVRIGINIRREILVTTTFLLQIGVMAGIGYDGRLRCNYEGAIIALCC